MINLVCLLEEASAQKLLEYVLPRLLGGRVNPVFRSFRGKQDFDNNVERLLRGWQNAASCFVLLRDQDSAPDCQALKADLWEKVKASGQADRTLVRLACRELETFYLGDHRAVANGLHAGHVAKCQRKAYYREPDKHINAKQQLVRLTGGRYQEISGSEAIAPFLALDGTNTSTSFNVLVDGIRRLVERQERKAEQYVSTLQS